MVKVYFPLFSLFLIFCSLDMICLCSPVWCSHTSWVCLVFEMNLGKFSVIIVSNIFCVPVYSFSGVPISYSTPFVVVPYFFFSFQSFSLHFSLLEVTVKLSPNLEILSSAMSSLLISTSKAVSISVSVFYISSISV